MSKIIVIDNKISELRLKKGWSIRDLATSARISFSGLSKVENGITSPRPKNAKAIADALEVEFDVIFKIV